MPDYIIEPLDTNAEDLFQDFVEYVQGFYPDWNPSEGQLDVIIGRYFANQASFTADMASRVLRAIFRYFGSSLANIPPLVGSAATGSVTFNLDPPDPTVSHTMPYGTLVGITDDDGDIQMFATLDDMTVAAGTLTGTVDIQAIDLGAISNGLTGAVQMIELVDWIADGAVNGSTSGGSDPEDDEIYIQRLTDNLTLMAPRPILAQDFALMAHNVPGVWRAAVIDNFHAGANEVQTFTSDYTGGTFTLFWNTQTTAPIPTPTTAAQMAEAMANLSNLDATDIIVAGGPLPTAPITVTWRGRYAYTNVATTVVTTTGLTGGTTFTVTNTTPGAAYATDLANSIAISAIDIDGNPLSDEARQQLIDYLQATRGQNFLITWVDPGYNVVDVTYTVHAYPGSSVESIKSDIDNRLKEYLSPAVWGTIPTNTSGRDWVPTNTIRYLELTTVVENTPGVVYTDSLTFAVNGGVNDSSNKTFPGSPFSLVKARTITGTVVTV